MFLEESRRQDHLTQQDLFLLGRDQLACLQAAPASWLGVEASYLPGAGVQAAAVRCGLTNAACPSA